MLAYAMLYFLAAYDTTASALTFTAYLLAANSDCQEKLIEETDNNIDKVLKYDIYLIQCYADAVCGYEKLVGQTHSKGDTQKL